MVSVQTIGVYVNMLQQRPLLFASVAMKRVPMILTPPPHVCGCIDNGQFSIVKTVLIIICPLFDFFIAFLSLSSLSLFEIRAWLEMRLSRLVTLLQTPTVNLHCTL